MTTKVRSLMLRTLYAAAFTAIPALPAGITLAVDPIQASVAVGATTTVDLTISGLGAMSPPSLSAFDLDLTFNRAVVSVSNTLFGSSSAPFDQLNIGGAGSITQANQPSSGNLHLVEVSLDSSSVLDSQQQASFILAEISLRGVQPGSTALSLSVNALGDSQGNPLAASGVAGGTLSVKGTSVVPEPASITLLCSGLAMLLALFLGRKLKVRMLPWSGSSSLI